MELEEQLVVFNVGKDVTRLSDYIGRFDGMFEFGFVEAPRAASTPESCYLLLEIHLEVCQLSLYYGRGNSILTLGVW